MADIYIYGKHPVEEALRTRPDSVERVMLEKADHLDIDALAKENKIPRGVLEVKKIKKEIGEHAVHQNVVAVINGDKLTTPLPELLNTLDLATNPSLVLLGEIQDPQNVGAIIRSAAALGVSGVLIPKDRQAQLTGSVIKASAGMAFKIPLVPVGNVNQTIRDLKEQGFWVYGLDGESEKTLKDEVFDAPSVFIVGNEGRGMREKTQEHCDVVLRIPMQEGVESLNAAVSAAVVFYEWSRGRN